ncbi:MAG: hypothetical protein V9E99_14335 [Microthrixaceae bacterium]|jgi:hypothetical protein|nr:hypothetical protein [Actinomycetota bacterium]HMS15065.1 hypothetical protein [Microthrixaceae bacterium]HMT23174.1 hypothetical protein [Microthrixaceae bacterium]HMT61001.1 hypothetical protein [Microthrixaceae bacterium]
MTDRAASGSSATLARLAVLVAIVALVAALRERAFAANRRENPTSVG